MAITWHTITSINFQLKDNCYLMSLALRNEVNDREKIRGETNLVSTHSKCLSFLFLNPWLFWLSKNITLTPTSTSFPRAPINQVNTSLINVWQTSRNRAEELVFLALSLAFTNGMSSQQVEGDHLLSERAEGQCGNLRLWHTKTLWRQQLIATKFSGCGLESLTPCPYV